MSGSALINYFKFNELCPFIVSRRFPEKQKPQPEK